MNYRLTNCIFLTLTLTVLASAQGAKPGGGGTGASPGSVGSRGPTTGTSSAPQPGVNNIPNPNDATFGQRAFISGKVVLDDGSQLTESAAIQTLCRGHRQTVARTDSHGGFMFEFGDRASAAAAGVGAADADSSFNPSDTQRSNQRDWRECELRADLPGFNSEVVDLNTRMTHFESTDIGRVVLHRMGQVQGLTISATSAAAPRDAQKAFEKGREKASKEKWDEAQPLFEKAVEIYPKYAVAWFELGRVQMHKNQIEQARSSFQQSMAADPKYANSYRGLAELALQEKQWPELVKITDQLLALNPVNYPDAWLRNALGNYYLRNLAVAEKSARQGMKIDEQHQSPRLEYLLGVILIQEQQYPEAATHIQNYLKGVTQPAEVEEAQKRLADITRLSASANAPADPPAKEEKK
ncbi:MAG TPA: tetratricopeptide repeat protein [Terriglobales bacterium]|jgi:tetratricopeptide (TPR) repeat protein|nr:tetratricopeptide repeat protein [Terriglobales bacterium]